MNQFALITGASSGIGYEYARVLADYHYNLIIISNEEDPLEEKAAELRQDFKHITVIPYLCDLSRQEAAKEIFRFCYVNNYRVEVLVNNAGVYHDKDFIKDTEKFNSLILNLHVYTPTMLMYYFGNDMAHGHSGYILNMSSITSSIPVQRLATYGATKAYLKNFSRSLHIELYRKKVYVTTVCPGAVATTLYNLNPSSVRVGLLLGYIVSPKRLARRAVRAMFHKRSCIRPPFIWNAILLMLIKLLPTGLLRLVRRLKIF